MLRAVRCAERFGSVLLQESEYFALIGEQQLQHLGELLISGRYAGWRRGSRALRF